MKTATLSLCVLFLSVASCSWVGTSKQNKVFDKKKPIDIHGSFYLNYPKDGFQKTFITNKLEQNPDSAKEVVSVLRKSLSQKLGQLTINDKNLKLEEAFKEASLKGSNYLIDIEIAQWKDASYFFCTAGQDPRGQFQEPASMDTVDLTIYIYDVKSKSLLNKQTIDNKGCPIVLADLIPIGKNNPSVRFSSMIEGWLKNVK